MHRISNTVSTLNQLDRYLGCDIVDNQDYSDEISRMTDQQLDKYIEQLERSVDRKNRERRARDLKRQLDRQDEIDDQYGQYHYHYHYSDPPTAPWWFNTPIVVT